MKIDCKKLRKKVLGAIKECITREKLKPVLAIIQVGDNAASNRYVKHKMKDSELCGIEARLNKYDKKDIFGLVDKIKELNEDDNVSAIMVQLPIVGASNEQTEVILNSIDAEKDVDGLSAKSDYNPCTPKGVIAAIDESGYEVAGAHAVILGRSNLVGRPLVNMLLDKDMTVTICHSKTVGVEKFIKDADVLILAMGNRALVNDIDMIKSGALLIDVGINFDEEDKLCGDLDIRYDELEAAHCTYTTVPGGIGLLTRTSLMANVFQAALDQRDSRRKINEEVSWYRSDRG